MNRLKNSNASIHFRILLAILTLLIVGGAVVGILRSKQQSFHIQHRKALEISEYGLMSALTHLHENPSWRDGLPKTKYNDGWYRVELKENGRGKIHLLTVTSVGGCGSVRQIKKMVLQRYLNDQDTSWVPYTN